jgi:predicted O-methyltransferase YrrM
MNFEKTNSYIELLYGNRKLSKRQYCADTELDNFGQVIDDDVARMLQVIILAAKPKKVLEIGTSIGFSTVMMANMMKEYGGKIVTIELDEKVAEQAKNNFARQGVDAQIEVIVGDARAIVNNMDQKFDLIFQDVGDKSLYAEMVNSYSKLLNIGGVLIAEDALFPLFTFTGKHSYLNDMREPLNNFNRQIAESTQFESTLLPIGDGVMIAVKKDSEA